jgi:type II secretory pathway pseudopilin PulG
MKIVQKNSRKAPIIATLVVILITAAAATAWFAYAQQNNANNSQTNTDSSKNDADSSIDSEKAQEQSATNTKEEAVNNDTEKETVPNQTPENNTLIVNLSSSGRDASTYRLRYLIEQNLASGTCTLTLTNGSKKITRQVPIQSLSSSSTCQGFDIDMSELSIGKWQADITVQSGNQTGKSSSTVTV